MNPLIQPKLLIQNHTQRHPTDHLPEFHVRPVHLLILTLAFIPLGLNLLYGPRQTVDGEMLAKRLVDGSAYAAPEARLMRLVQNFNPVLSRVYIFVQSLIMGLVILLTAITGSSVSGRRRITPSAALLLVGLVEWIRWAPCISPEPLAHALGTIGLFCWFDLKRNPKQFCEQTTLLIVVLGFWIAAAVLSGFWLLVAIPALFDIGFGWILIRNGKHAASRCYLVALILVFFMACYLFLPWTLQRRAEQSREGVLRQGQIISGYPDFRIYVSSHSSELQTIRQDLKYQLKLGTLRILAEVIQIRPFFSFRHNLFILFVCFPVVLIGCWGLIRSSFQPEMMPFGFHGFAWLLVVSQAGADWEGRMLMALWPTISVFASLQFSRFRFGVFLRRILLLTLLVLVPAGMFHKTILTRIGNFLVVDHRHPSDVLVVLVGGEPDRDALAANLFKEGDTQEIWVVNENDLLENDPYNDAGKLIRRMVTTGVPRERIHLLPSAWNTYEEARRVAETIRKRDPEKRPVTLTVITTTFHTRRAAYLFQKEVGPLVGSLFIAASQDMTLAEENWWLDTRTRYLYLQELAMYVFTRIVLAETSVRVSTPLI